METKKDFWIRTFQEWESSGLKRREFCDQRGLTIPTFDYWRIKVKKDAAQAEEKSLVKLPIQFPSAASSISVEMASGCKINIPENYDSLLLKRLVLDLNEVLK